jgi:iron complex transport system substrate-binding protein
MRVVLSVAGLLLLAALGGLVFLGRADPQGRSPAPQAPGDADTQPRRIVSLSPSVTEILYALGLGDRVVGVSRYCKYPAEAQSKPQVGGYLDPSYEAIVALEPDLVVLRGENEQFVKSFRDLGLNLLRVNHDGVEGILDSMTAIGRRCGADAQAERMVADIQAHIHRITQRTANLDRPRVMVVAERTLASGKIQNVYVAGSNNFMNRMILLAGGKNACTETSAGFPVVSGEGIVRMNPQVIIDLLANARQAGLSAEEVVRDWQQLPDVDAVRSGRVYLVDDDYAFIPGPRFILLVEKLARLIHPGKETTQ